MSTRPSLDLIRRHAIASTAEANNDIRHEHFSFNPKKHGLASAHTLSLTECPPRTWFNQPLPILGFVAPNINILLDRRWRFGQLTSLMQDLQLTAAQLLAFNLLADLLELLEVQNPCVLCSDPIKLPTPGLPN